MNEARAREEKVAGRNGVHRVLHAKLAATMRADLTNLKIGVAMRHVVRQMRVVSPVQNLDAARQSQTTADLIQSLYPIHAKVY